MDGFGVPVEWALCVVILIFKRKGDIRNYSCYGAVKLLEHGMKVVERVLVKKLINRIVTIDEMQFVSMPDGRTIDAVFILRWQREDNHAKQKKLCTCSMDLEKAFDRAPRKVLEWAMRRKGIPDFLGLDQ